MKVTLILPTRNEEGSIKQVLSEVDRHLIQEIIMVDGHSKDKTVSEARRVLKKQDKIIRQKKTGYGDAFLEGCEKASGDVIIMMDADGSHDPHDIKKILAKYKKGYQYVMASRYAKGGKSEDDTIIRRFGNTLFTALTNLIHRTHVTDSLYLFTAIGKSDFQKLNLTSPGFEFCTEILVKAHKADLKFAEVPAVERKRFAGKTKVNALADGWKILKMILRRY